ncbi:GGDEF domain-containing protein [Chromobacterium aquaticum]|uniref:diguanylate cyclase n=1 Tax=Chromobacterium aquaticum TaxID=467180 RepID=A0ABV8ZVK4_9NEIS|nr:GGDEF domain-containing protein [Chromobacterium aquaticum]MCD5360569.1 GGDEF domain-containing protein [Chromobacterium aquaticum]
MKQSPNEDDSKRILDNLVELTSQREQDMLESSLLSTLVEVMRVDKVELFACRWVNGVPYIRRRLSAAALDGKAQIAETAHDSWLPPPIFLYDLLNALDKDDGIFRIPHGLCLPLRCMGSIISLLIIHAGSEQKVNKAMLKAMARIHENFLRLLFEADRDMLTALNNRRKFDLRLFNLMATQLQSPEEQTHCTLALLDVDHFKQVNDQYGHMVGDEVLLLLAQLMQQSFREDDSLFRYGGEEFAIIFQGLAPEQAAVALERFRVRVEQYPFPQVGSLTVSLGYTRILPQLLPGQLVEQADRALYYAKSNGRNQVHGYEELIAGGLLDNTQRFGEIDLF